MSLTKITLRNFKSIGEEAQTIELAPYTLLFGPNSAGKSTLIQALAFIHELLSVGTRDISKTKLGGDSIDLGGFLNVVHNRDPNKDIEVKVECNVSSYNLDHYPDPNLEWRTEVPWPTFLNGIERGDLLLQVDLVIGLDADGERVRVKRLQTSVNGQIMGSVSSTNDGQQISVSSFTLGALYYSVEHFGADGPLKTIWGDDDFADDKSDDNDSMAQQFREAIFEKGAQVDIEEVFPGILERMGQAWTLDQRDALPERVDFHHWRLEWPYDVQEQYSAIEDEFLGRQLNQYRLLDALICVPLGLMDAQVSGLLYIGPLRDIPTAEDLSTRRGNDGGWASGAAAWNAGYLSEGDKFGYALEMINRWLDKNFLATGYKVRSSETRALPKDHPILSSKQKTWMKGCWSLFYVISKASQRPQRFFWRTINLV